MHRFLPIRALLVKNAKDGLGQLAGGRGGELDGHALTCPIGGPADVEVEGVVGECVGRMVEVDARISGAEPALRTLGTPADL
jgi:hypothetical protein